MSEHTQAGAGLTELILEVFRLNGALIASGDDLVRDLGLTSARWQVLGAVAIAGRPMSVAQIARRMGLSRQAVQRVANDLEGAGLTTYRINPDHKRAKLVALTKQGERAFAAADARQIVWVNALAEDCDARSLAAAARILKIIGDRCDRDPGSDGNFNGE